MIYAESEESPANLNLFDRINEVRLTGDKVIEWERLRKWRIDLEEDEEK